MATGVLQFHVGAISDVGTVRANNEDSYLATNTLLVVSDGVGGRPAGEVASHIATRTAGAVIAAGGDPVEGLRAADDLVASTAKLNSFFSGMCCTLTMASLTGSTVRIAHVGDSRAYLIRGGRFTQLTHDHTLVSKLVAEGALTLEQAATDPRRNTIYQFVGRGELEPWLRTFRTRVGDRLVLCSDGVSHFLPDDKLAAVVADQIDPQHAAEDLCRIALDAGSNDNVTAVIADVGPVPAAPALPL